MLRADPLAIGASRIDRGDPASRDLIREALYADVSFETADAAISMLNVDAPVGIVTEGVSVTRDRFGSIPHTYIVCTADRMMKPALQRRIIADIDSCSTEETRTVELHTSHSPFLSQPRQLADAIEAAWRLSPGAVRQPRDFSSASG